ncbi:MAG: hypothetical protein E7262_02555 [Lachnospiraceae bacterium]|nr:hypothetical protein [Lachnospiraceae bacterium]
MSRLTCKYDGDNTLRELCTFDRESDIEADDCMTCDEYCDAVEAFNGTCSDCAIQKAIDKLAEYEELEEKGLLLKLPCKIGDTVYQLINSHIYEYKIIGICFDILHNKWMYEVAYEIGLEWFKTMCDFDVFGKSKTVFLTKEEAEKELERLNEQRE